MKKRGSGWSYKGNINGYRRTLCRSCNKRTNNKPSSECTSSEHVLSYKKGGYQARKTQRSGSEFCLWLKRNNYPSGFRVLCAGCNISMEVGQERCVLHC